MVAQSAILPYTVCQIDSGQEFREIIKENSEINRVCKLCITEWKFHDFSITQIL